MLADRSCNNDKRDLLPSPPLVDAWAGRNREHQGTLASLCGWDSDPEGTLAVARSIYRHLPAGLAPFWSGTGTGPYRNACRVVRAMASGAAPPIGQAVISVNGRVATQPPSRCPPECA